MGRESDQKPEDETSDEDVSDAPIMAPVQSMHRLDDIVKMLVQNQRELKEMQESLAGLHKRFERKPLSEIQCYTCGEMGHVKSRCPNGANGRYQGESVYKQSSYPTWTQDTYQDTHRWHSEGNQANLRGEWPNSQWNNHDQGYYNRSVSYHPDRREYFSQERDQGPQQDHSAQDRGRYVAMAADTGRHDGHMPSKDRLNDC